MTETTYELRIAPLVPSAYMQSDDESLKAWLSSQGEDSFVEAQADNLDLADTSWEIGYDPTPDIDSHVIDRAVVIYKYSRSELERIASAVKTAFPNRYQIALKEIPTTSWRDGWKDSFKPVETNRFLVYPPWEENLSVPNGKIPLEIEPATAFGTGQHATTCLCLDALETIEPWIKPSDNLPTLDLGTGSGILTVGARKFGYKEIDAWDIDPDAIQATIENVCRNGIDPDAEPRLDIRQATIEDVERKYGLIIANILAVILRPMMPQLSHALLPGAILVLSGILEEQSKDLLSAANELPLSLKSKKVQDGWCVLIFRKES